MKISRSLTAFAASLVLAGAVFAANAAQGKLRLYDSVSVQGKQLAPGNYKVEWSGNGPDVQVTIFSGKDTIATLPAKVVPTTAKNSENGYSAIKQADGSNDLQTIFFQGKTFELQVSQQAANGSSQPTATGSN